MTFLQYCIYRNKSNLGICKCKKNLKEALFCIKHSENDDKMVNIYKSIYEAVKYKNILNLCDYYLIFKSIDESLFRSILMNITKKNLLLLFEKYKFDKSKRKILIKKIIDLFNNTLYIEKHHMETVIFLQRKYRKKNIYFTNNEDPFTYTPLEELSINSIFSYKENDKSYGFDAVELLYFIEKNNNDKIESYNPYTRKLFDKDLIDNLNLFIMKNNLIKKDINMCIWKTDIHAYTDLSLIIEKAGFYNSPLWFFKLKNKELMAIIKIYNYLTNNKDYYNFKNKGCDSLVFYFCKESIKIFKNYNENYTLCCNFIKALSMLSNDFYINLPEWIIEIETTPRNIFDINDFLLFYYISINE